MKRLTLLEARDKKGWTQQALAERSGVSQQAISAIETGESANPSIATVEALEVALGVKRGTLKFSAHEAVA